MALLLHILLSSLPNDIIVLTNLERYNIVMEIEISLCKEGLL